MNKESKPSVTQTPPPRDLEFQVVFCSDCGGEIYRHVGEIRVCSECKRRARARKR